jgi:hypothetical protein
MSACVDRILGGAARSDGACPTLASRPSPEHRNEGSHLSTESIASPSSPATGAGESCAACGAPLADDQRYCLECGERRFPMSSVLLGGPPSGGLSQPQAPPMAPPPNGSTPADGAGRGGAVTVIAGVGVLLLAMGVGVLIGRSGSSKPSVAPAQVISVASGAGTSTGASTESSFTGDWPSGTNGYTVQLQTLPQSSTRVSAVQAAKSAATAKGATGVGALKSEEFTSLTAGNYVIYAGVDHSKSEAEKALAGLKKSFPAASVISVSNGGASSSSSGSSSSGGSPGKSGVGSSESHPAPPTVVQNLSKKKGKSYEQESKNLPNVISTG